jgi:hypothetical protein
MVLINHIFFLLIIVGQYFFIIERFIFIYSHKHYFFVLISKFLIFSSCRSQTLYNLYFNIWKQKMFDVFWYIIKMIIAILKILIHKNLHHFIMSILKKILKPIFYLHIEVQIFLFLIRVLFYQTIINSLIFLVKKSIRSLENKKSISYFSHIFF